MQRRVGNTRKFKYCQCMAQMVSYPDVTCTVHVRLKWSVDRHVERLELCMIAVWRKRENNHCLQ
jgi:hypothetical protein